jgi:predicted transcriptional regulator
MKRTQIQLPDRLYERLKARAAAEESTLAEIMRQAGEYYLAVHPEAAATVPEWTPPAPRDLGAFLVPEDRWREMANDEEISR